MESKKLIELGGAYYCFCSKERLSAVKEACVKEGKAYKYDRHCLHMNRQDIEQRLASGEPFVISSKNARHREAQALMMLFLERSQWITVSLRIRC